MVRTRFAPSPTGYMHIGGLRTALFEYLIAKSNGGIFILRIEDTDASRYVAGAEGIIYDTLKTAGIIYDEGPDIGGAYGPYIQSERKTEYLNYAKQLIDSGGAYYCFCEDTHSGKGGSAKYDRRCLNLSVSEIEVQLSRGMKYVIRQRIPEGITTFYDHVYGEITVDNIEIEDQILIKSDLMPTYNFANVIDDHLMRITHVVRGSEYLSSTPKYNLLYKALNFDIPEYIHLPLVLNEEGEKLSKRQGHTSFADLTAQGFLPDAIVNYIALLGFAPPDNREILSLNELISCFDIKRLNKSPSRFDIQKLKWMNGEYFKKMPDDTFHEMALPFIKEAVSTPGVDFNKLAMMVKTRAEVLYDIKGMLDFIDRLPKYDVSLYIHKKMKTDLRISLSALEMVVSNINNISAWNNDALYAWLTNIARDMGLKNSQVLWPVRTALSGKPITPCGASELMEILGKDESVKRVKHGIDKCINS